jgi:hypothetical protein
MSDWGPSILSTLVYVETRVVDHGGRLDHRYLNADDYNNLDLLEEEGLLVNKGTGTNRAYQLTDAGWEAAGKERRRRAEKYK